MSTLSHRRFYQGGRGGFSPPWEENIKLRRKGFVWKLWPIMYQTGLVREEVKKKTDYIMRLIKTVGGYPWEITISWSLLEIVACHWGRWVSKEDITKSKQTFMVVLYLIRGPSGQKFCNMVMDFFVGKFPLRGGFGTKNVTYCGKSP